MQPLETADGVASHRSEASYWHAVPPGPVAYGSFIATLLVDSSRFATVQDFAA
jgi:hypothetical protein